MDQFPGLLAKDSRDFSSSSVFDDVFGGPPKFSNKPVYDDEHIFDGLPGLKNSSSVNSSKNAFSSAPNESSNFDDLLGNLGRMGSKKASGSAFDDLIPGFGENRGTSKSSVPQQSTVPSTISTSSVGENPFAFLQSASVPAYASQRLFSEPSPQAKPNQSSSIDVSSVQGKILDGLESNDSIAKLKPFPPSGGNGREKDGSHFCSSSYMMHSFAGKEPSGEPLEISDNSLQKNKPVNNIQESHQSPFDVPTSSHSHHTFTQNASHTNTRSTETNSHRAMSPQSEDSEEAADVWLTVSEITLTTLPTSAPPPSRPPPRQYQSFKEVKGSVKSKKPNNFSSFDRSGQSYWSPQTVLDASKNPYVSSVDELEAFAMGGTQSNADEHADVISNEENADNSAAAASAAAMKDAVDRAEVKFKHARQVRERENAAKVSGAQRESDEKFKKSIQEQDLREEQERLDCEREERGRDEKDGERRRIEKEREQALEIERDREKGRQAVDRVMKEVRERAAAEARQRSERVAVDKVNAGARERAERAAVQRAQAEARERAAREVRERAEKAASEAIERKNTEEKEKAAAMAKAEAEARIRADRASVNRANAEARERAAAAAAATARGKQQKDGNDLDSFFNASARPDNTSKPRAGSPDSVFDAHRHNKPGPEGTQHPSAGTSSSMRKAYSGTNIVDDLDSIFGATSPPADIQENVGETDGRRKSRLERDQRTQERTERALAEKNERDRHTQWEQAERQRMAESLDFEIKRWSAGKEGNLRALLATLHYVLWPECGWQPVSLTDLITYESVKKVYRKSTLFVHPDKVQQKGANLQQKYIAEKVFDLLKEAWNKLNSEELF